jgi:Biotin carboxylase, N-terminal domain
MKDGREPRPMKRVLIANRGEIAVRVNRTCRDMGMETVQVYSHADRDSLAVRLADRSVCIGNPRSSESYLNARLLVSAGVAFQADAVHPGYGFLSENKDFAELCIEQGITWIGPPPDLIRLMGNKVAARKAASDAGLGWSGERCVFRRGNRGNDRLSDHSQGFRGRRRPWHAARHGAAHPCRSFRPSSAGSESGIRRRLVVRREIRRPRPARRGPGPRRRERCTARVRARLFVTATQSKASRGDAGAGLGLRDARGDVLRRGLADSERWLRERGYDRVHRRRCGQVATSWK